MLTDQGLDIFLTLTPGLDIGVWNDDPGGGFYNIRNVKYIGHEVNLDSGFVEQMKASMNATGGLLSMSSTTYRYYSDNVTSTSATHTANISCRVKSLKGLIVRPQNSDLGVNTLVSSLYQPKPSSTPSHYYGDLRTNEIPCLDRSCSNQSTGIDQRSYTCIECRGCWCRTKSRRSHSRKLSPLSRLIDWKLSCFARLCNPRKWRVALHTRCWREAANSFVEFVPLLCHRVGIGG